jgi:hypothetical protein
MAITNLIRAVYALLGILDLFIGFGAMLLPAKWLPSMGAVKNLTALYAAEAPDSYLNHLTQEFGTLAVAVGMAFVWQASRPQPNHTFHWMMTFYLSLDSLIHWFGPQGLIGDWQRGITNSIPPLVMVLLGLLCKWQR